MPHVPPEVIDEIRNVANIVEIISEYVSLRKVGKNYVALCPFHQEDTPSFTVSEEKQIFHCFGCGVGGNVFTFLMQYKQCSFFEALEEVANRYGINLPKVGFTPEEEAAYNRRKQILMINQWAAKFYHHYLLQSPEAQKAREYFTKRGIGKDTIAAYLLGFAPSKWDALTKFLRQKEADLALAVETGLVIEKTEGKLYDRFRERIIFPIFDFKGQVIAFGGRVLDESLPKYINSPETPVYKKGFNLYGAHVAREWCRREDKVLVVEGYFDLLSLHAVGIKYAVATLGTALTPNQIRLLKNLASRVVIVYDADAAGQKAAIRALPLLLKEDLVVDILLLPSGDDPDSFVQREGGEAFLQLLNYAQPLLDWYLKKGEEETKTDLNQRYQFLREAINVVSFLKNPLMQSHYQDKICQLFSLDPSLLATLKPSQAHSFHEVGPTLDFIEDMPGFEKNIIKFILSYPDYLPWFIKEDILEEVKHPLLHSLLKKIVKFYEEYNTLNVNSLIMDIEEPLRKLIVRWSIEEGEYAEPDEIAQGFLRLLRERQFKKLLKAIKEAEGQGDWQRLSALLRQKNELACNLKKN